MNLLMLILTYLANCHFAYCDNNLSTLFEKINSNFVKLNSIAASITWQSTIKPYDEELQLRTANYQKKWVVWQQSTCGQLAALGKRQLLNETQRRQTYLLCRGPKYTYREARQLTSLYDELQSLYSNNKICIPTQWNVSKENIESTETAILDYLSTVNRLLKIQNGANFAAKMAAKSDVDASKGLCLDREDDFGKLMKNVKNEEVLKWLWLVWREKIGEPMKEPYRLLVELENRASWRNGYTDIGASWRDELEVPDLRQKCRRLYYDIKPLYTLLHGVVRFYIRRQYGALVPKNGPIPAHLLGDLWSQNWERMADLITPKRLDLDDSIRKLNWTLHHMVKRVEDFYQSLGLPAMTDTFWRESIFEKKNGGTHCHGSAADMFQNGDFRLVYCSGLTMEDFYVLHHEFGHIHYYMAYDTQPGLFRQANAAFHESIGDAIMHGVMTPQHLHRLGLVNDSILYVNNSNDFNLNSATGQVDLEDEVTQGEIVMKRSFQTNENIEKHKTTNEEVIAGEEITKLLKKNRNLKLETEHSHDILNTNDNFENGLEDDHYQASDVKNERSNFNPFHRTKNFGSDDDDEMVNDLTSDELILLKQALNKIPQIPFGLVVDEYRWKYFEGGIDSSRLNKEFWDLTLELQGIAPPLDRSEDYFDIGAKFHVPDNTPYVRYFLSSFIQHQIFEALCRAAVFGRRDATDIPDTITLNRCDIYGSKAAGKLLKDFLSRGHSQHWQEILMSTTGNTEITAEALQRYYRPLYEVLARIVRKHNIPLGW